MDLRHHIITDLHHRTLLVKIIIDKEIGKALVVVLHLTILTNHKRVKRDITVLSTTIVILDVLNNIMRELLLHQVLPLGQEVIKAQLLILSARCHLP